MISNNRPMIHTIIYKRPKRYFRLKRTDCSDSEQSTTHKFISFRPNRMCICRLNQKLSEAMPNHSKPIRLKEEKKNSEPSKSYYRTEPNGIALILLKGNKKATKWNVWSLERTEETKTEKNANTNTTHNICLYQITPWSHKIGINERITFTVYNAKVAKPDRNRIQIQINLTWTNKNKSKTCEQFWCIWIWFAGAVRTSNLWIVNNY